jgi:hypothetical protein
MPPRRQIRDLQPPSAAELTVCPSCGEHSLRPHCKGRFCGWLLCINEQCKSFGIPGQRWCDRRLDGAV